MKPTSRPSYRRVLATVLGLLSRRQPLALAAFVCSGILLMSANVLVFHLLEGVMSQLGAGDRVGQLAGAIIVVGVAILLRELLEMVADPLSVYFGGKGMSALTEALNDKAARLEIIAFEKLDAHEGLELAKQGADAAVSIRLFFLFPVYQMTFFVIAAGYLFSLSPLLALVIPLMFAPRLASYFIQGSRFYRFDAGPCRCCASTSTWNAAWWIASISRRPGSWGRGPTCCSVTAIPSPASTRNVGGRTCAWAASIWR